MTGARRSTAWALALSAGLLVPSVASAGATTRGADPLGWSRAVYEASRFGLRAEAEVAVEVRPSGSCGLVPLETDGGGPEADPACGVVTIESSLLGRSSTNWTRFDPVRGDALQYDVLEVGHRNRSKTIRYGRTGRRVIRRNPAPGEEDRAPEAWSEISEVVEPFPAAPAGVPIIEPSALLYLLSAWDLAKPGDGREVLVAKGDHLVPVRIRVEDLVQLEVDYRAIRGDETEAVAGKVEGIRIALIPAVEGEVELLGLSGDLKVILDLATRVPLEVSGRLKIVGRVTTSLQEVDLRSDPAPAGKAP